LQADIDVSEVVGCRGRRTVCIDTDHFVFLYLIAASALPSGHFFMCLTSHLGVVPKISLLTTGDTERVFEAHVTVFG
jgi:hypothetical protein